MALNANLILAGQTPDIIGSMARGQQAGAQMNDIRRTNEMRNMLQANGAGIARGEQGALNALAAYDPQAALGVQNTRLGMESTQLGMENTREQMAMRRRDEARQIQAAAAQATAAERAAMADQIKASISMGLQVQSPQEWDAIMAQRNPDMVGMFDQREALAGEYMSLADSIARMDERNETPDPVRPNSSIGKLQADLAAGLIDQQQYEMAVQGMAPSGMRVVTNPDGTMTFEQGAGVTGGNGKDLTVDAAKNTGFLIRARESQEVLNRLESEGTNMGARLLNAVPLGVGNYAQSEEYQMYDQAKRDMINAILRRESGAVIADSEFANADRQYFPQPGDSPAVIAQKRTNRENAIAGMQIGSGDGVNRIGGNQPTASAPDFSTMSIEEIEAFIAQNGG